MKKRKLRQPRILVILKLLTVLTLILCFILGVTLMGMEARQKKSICIVSEEISQLQSNKNILQLKKQDLTSADRLNQITRKYKLAHGIDSEVAAVHGKNHDK